MKLTYRQAARDDVIRQFRYYLVDQNLLEVAIRFREAVRKTVKALRHHPAMGPAIPAGESQDENSALLACGRLRGDSDLFSFREGRYANHRILHGKRDVRSILERE